MAKTKTATKKAKGTKATKKKSSPKKATEAKSEEIKIERRKGAERRKTDDAVAMAKAGGERRKVQRRRQIDPTTCERDYTPEEIEFMRALDEYKRANGRMFPTCSEILEVVRGLGYERRDLSGADAGVATETPAVDQALESVSLAVAEAVDTDPLDFELDHEI